MKTERFIGKTAIVTGGAMGMGEAITRRFIKEGGKAAILDINRDKMDDLVKELDGKAKGYICNVADEENVKECFHQILNDFGHIDCLFNNCGIIGRGAFQDTPVSLFRKTFEVNVLGIVNVSQAVTAQWIKEGSGGVIVNTGSINSMYGAPNLASYNTSKGAVLMLSRSMAIDLAPYNIRVNVLAPSATKTPMTVNTVANEEYTKNYFTHLNIKRYAEPEENAAVALFLASDDASYMSGSFILNDGGISCRQF